MGEGNRRDEEVLVYFQDCAGRWIDGLQAERDLALGKQESCHR